MKQIIEEVSAQDQNILDEIRSLVNIENMDNVTRTKAYSQFYNRNPEIKWAFLASMVSRNAGWNMCDLEGLWYPMVLNKNLRYRLFLTYERANWLIFSDAYPQLCLYEKAKSMNKDLSYLLPFFHISPFMQNSWREYWNTHNGHSLLISQIINEQNLIQRPVINHPVYRKEVFNTWLFLLSDWFHFSSVIFPTSKGKLYGCSVHDFRSVTCRIDLGKKLASILFKPDLYYEFLDFSRSVEHTGSRGDYEGFIYNSERKKNTPVLRDLFPVIAHHRDDFQSWVATRRQLKIWKKPITLPRQILLTQWYEKKQKQIHAGIIAESLIRKIIQ